MPSINQAYGNAEVQLVLERFQEEARKGRIGYIVIAAVTEPNNLKCQFSGSVGLEPIARLALDRLVLEMDKSLANRTWDVDQNLGADYACYNVARAPINYDFIPWLVDSEMERLRAGAPAPLKVAIGMGRDGETLPVENEMLATVVRPAMAMLGAVEDPRALNARFKEMLSFRDIVAGSRAGERVPLFEAPAISRDMASIIHGGKHSVTITLREAEHWPHRNSSLDAWLRFADYLQKRGENVILVRDTAKANEIIPGFTACPLASTDLHVRVALYASSKANLFVSNGPATLAFFGASPWLMFIPRGEDGHAYEPGTPQFWHDNVGIEQGEQFPWCARNQRIIWQKDDYENIVAAWERWIENDVPECVAPAA